ncbi:MAG: LacI family DNA-binding transcriptional regulator [Candidatus Bipolaricaulota bacterium]
MKEEGSRKDNVTIKDVAKEAGVATSTASMALNNKPTISTRTKETVLEAAQKLGYHPTAAARALVDGKPSNLGLLIPVKVDNLFFSTGFFQKLISGMSKATKEAGNIISLQVVETREETAEQITRAWKTKNISGSIITHPTTEMPYLDVIEEYDYPVVFLGEPPRDFPYVDNDNFNAAKTATGHLIEHEHEKIGFLGGPDDLIASGARERGYRTAMESAGIKVQHEYIWSAEHTEQSAYQEVMKRGEQLDFTAICISVEEQMPGVYRALRDLELSIPDDVALITLGDSQLARHINPPMTVLDLHTEKLGYLAAKKLNQAINGKQETTRRKVETDLITRSSCGCNSNQGGGKNIIQVNSGRS